MYVLVDFDNLDSEIRRRGPKHATEKIASVLIKNLRIVPKRFEFRFYGGWYEATGVPTRLAQQLAARLQGDFPFVYRPISQGQQYTYINIQAVLAYALLIDPQNHLLHTYRIRQNLKGIKITDPQIAGCSLPDCGLRNIKMLVKKGRCPESNCNITVGDILQKAEQKLVDVMLANDLLYIVHRDSRESDALDSSDEDLWPAIRQALEISSSVIHIQAKSNQRTPSYYRDPAGSKYIEYVL